MTGAGDRSTELAAIGEAVDEILSDHCTDERVAAVGDGWDERLWSVLDDAGFTTVGVPEAAGGSGGDLAAAAAVLLACGRHCAPVPVAESVLAGHLRATTGLASPPGRTLAARGELRLTHQGGRAQATGTLRRAPVAAHAPSVLTAVACDPDGAEHVVLIPSESCTVIPGRNLAGEHRSRIEIDLALPPDSVAAAPTGTGADLRLLGALTRAALLTGAVHGVLARTARYVTERIQFGRPLARFQAIQQDIARLAGEAAACQAAVDAAVGVLSGPGSATERVLATAAAKIQAARGAETAAATGHQLHGAIGMTLEHGLRLHTTRLWSWAEEWGGEAEWAAALTAAVGDVGEGGLWRMLTSA